MNNYDLWYGADEVRVFHPILSECINASLKKIRIDNEYELIHHDNSLDSGIPDFAIIDKRTRDYICIIEAKKTPNDVYSEVYGRQARKYVKELYPLRWKKDFYPHFCVTNIEYIQSYSFRENASIIGCLLENSPFKIDDIYSQNIQNKFTNYFSDYLSNIIDRKSLNFSLHLEEIKGNFEKTYLEIEKILSVNLNRIHGAFYNNDILINDIFYDLLRLLFYSYLKEFYNIKGLPQAKFFNNLNTNLTDKNFIKHILENYENVMKLDFISILKNNNSETALIPNIILEKENQYIIDLFKQFTTNISENINGALNKSLNTDNYISIITDKVYSSTSVSESVKVMSDNLISDLLANLANINQNHLILDPCCGDGNLLISAYNKLNKFNLDHNQILSKLHGIEIDKNLSQLCSFKLLSKNLIDINSKTETFIETTDYFKKDKFKNKYDVILMNPPYLRNEDLNIDDKENWIFNIEKNIKSQSFIHDVSQPNLFYFFIEKTLNLLKDDGVAIFILMSKFLNNVDGIPLKKFLNKYLVSIIDYPPDFFEDVTVTTNIFILKKNAPSNISFLKIKDTNIFKDESHIYKILNSESDQNTDEFSLNKIDKSDLDYNANWKNYFGIDLSLFDKFMNDELLLDINQIFEIKRGSAGNSGGVSKYVYPYKNENDLKEQFININKDYTCFGLERNSVYNYNRKIFLTNECLSKSKGIYIPFKYDDNFFKKIKKLDRNFYIYLKEISQKSSNFKGAVNDCYKSYLAPELIIPRGDRIKHIVFYNKQDLLLSTNFFSLSGLRDGSSSSEINILFICAFFNSSFGQLFFEVFSNNQEGSRKLEKFIIEKFKVPSLSRVDQTSKKKIINELKKLNDKNQSYLGIEENNIRLELDRQIALLFNFKDYGYKNNDSFVSDIQNLLKALVLKRKYRNESN